MVLDTVNQGLSSPFAIAQAIAKDTQQYVATNLIKRKLVYAQRQGYMQRFGDVSHPHYQLSNAGEQRLAQLKFQVMSFEPKQWDGHWRVLIFDIPEKQRFVRDMIRRLIKQLGMRRLQRSVWVTPADCQPQFKQLKQAYDLKYHLLLLQIRHIPEMDHLKHHWNL